jgi:hypothetical protein
VAALEENFIENIFRNGWQKATDTSAAFSQSLPFTLSTLLHNLLRFMKKREIPCLKNRNGKMDLK